MFVSFHPKTLFFEKGISSIQNRFLTQRNRPEDEGLTPPRKPIPDWNRKESFAFIEPRVNPN